MKIAHIALTTVLVLLILIGAAACSFLTMPHSEELELKIYTYLEEKYPDLEFKIQGYTQETYTNGKYVFHVLCKTTEVEFQIYHSSFLTTDSYSVTYANLSAEKMLFTSLGESLTQTYIQSIQWLNPYADGNTGYKFRDVDLSQWQNSVSDIESIHKIKLSTADTDSTLQAIQAITEKLNSEGIACDRISFEWVQEDYTIVFNTNMFTLNNASNEEMLAFLSYLCDGKQSDENITVSYISRTKYATLFLDELENGESIPGFGNLNSEHRENEKNIENDETSQK